jgi:dihydrofolate reductase
MALIVWDVSVSIDGFTTGPNVRAEAPMGEGGEALHYWLDASGPDAGTDRAMVDRVNAGLGASIVGRRTFELGLSLWGGTPWANLACFVITHRPRADFVGDNGGHFYFCSLDEAARRARSVAGDRNVNILGADVARQLLRAGQVDRLRLHTVPILLGDGTPLFKGEKVVLTPEGRPEVGAVVHQCFRLNAH